MPVRLEAPQRLVERGVGQQQQLAIGEPAEVARPIDDAGVDARDLRRAAQRLDPRVDVVAVVGDRVPFGRREDDVELIEVAETRDERPERLDDAAVAAAAATARRSRTTGGGCLRPTPASAASTATQDDRAPTVRRADDRGNQRGHGAARRSGRVTVRSAGPAHYATFTRRSAT